MRRPAVLREATRWASQQAWPALPGDATLIGRSLNHGAQTCRAPGCSLVRCRGKSTRATCSAATKAASRISTAARPGADLAAGRSRGRPVLFTGLQRCGGQTARMGAGPGITRIALMRRPAGAEKSKVTATRLPRGKHRRATPH
jgi:hypothetical protein